jgi:hypothetical protein
VDTCVSFETVAAADLERWDRAVCLHTETPTRDGKPSFKSASAFMLLDGNRLFLATAAHAARETSASTKILYRTKEGESRWLTLDGCRRERVEPWRYHPSSDVAVMNVETSKLDDKTIKALFELAIPVNCLVLETPGRTAEIEIVGFPMAIGTRPSVSPLVMKGCVASRETETENRWGTEPIVFAIPAAGAGCSGGPVFSSHDNHSIVRLVGMSAGFHADETGAKLCKVVPARIIQEVVNQLRADARGDRRAK